MQDTAQEMQPRIEAVLDVAIACGLLSGAARPWLLKWLMAALDESATLDGLCDIPRGADTVAAINDGIRRSETGCVELEYSTMIVLPTREDAREFSRARLAPTSDNSSGESNA